MATEDVRETVLEQQASEVEKASRDVFDTILAYQNDAQAQVMRAVSFIMLKGVENKELRDEIYAQLVKQTRSPPNNQTRKRGWQLMAFVTGFFPPSERLLSYVAAYLADPHSGSIVRNSESSQDTAQWASFCLNRLRRINKNGRRSMPPSTVEIDAVLKRQNFPLRVYMMDNSFKELTIDSAATVAEVFGTLTVRTRIKDPRGFALFEEVKHLERSLQENEKLGDELAKLERLQERYRSQAGKLLRGEDDEELTKFVFKKRLYLDVRYLSKDPVENNFLFHQIWCEFLIGRVSCNDNEAVRLGALLLQFQEGDYVPETDQEREARIEEATKGMEGIFDAEELHVPRVDIYEYLPKPLLDQSQHVPREWEEDLLMLHEALDGTEVGEAKVLFLKAAKELPLFGVSMFKLEHKSDWQMPAVIALGIGIDGVLFMNWETKETIYKLPLRALHTYYYEKNCVRMFFDYEGKDMKITLFTKEVGHTLVCALGARSPRVVLSVELWRSLESLLVGGRSCWLLSCILVGCCRALWFVVVVHSYVCIAAVLVWCCQCSISPFLSFSLLLSFSLFQQ
jgi:MyTH4 domain/RA like domain/FERM central domain